MALTIEVETQGISDDWLRADGDFTVKPRGLLGADQVQSAMAHLAPLDTPDGGDVCAPQIVTRGDFGSFSFIGQGGSIYCPETETEMTARIAADMALGKAVTAPPPPLARRRPPSQAPARPVAPPRQRRKFGWRGGIVLFLSLCFLLGAIVMVFGVLSMRARGMPDSDVLAATTISGALALIGVLMLALAFKARRSEFFDTTGTRVNSDGSALPFIAMADSLGDYDDGFDGGFDGDFD